MLAVQSRWEVGWVFMVACSLFCIALDPSVSLGFPPSSRCQNLFITPATLPIFLLVSHCISRLFLLLIRYPYHHCDSLPSPFPLALAALQSPAGVPYNHFEEITNHACYLGDSSLRMVGKTLLLMGHKLMLRTANLCVCQPLSHCTVQPYQGKKESFSLLSVHLLPVKEADKWHASGLLQKVLVLCSVYCEHNIVLKINR